jgi:peptide/nickel transport system permease protein
MADTRPRSPWSLVWERFARRRVALAALAVLALLSGLAVYAPLIASAEPYYLVAADVRAVRSASSSLPALASELERAVAARAGFAEDRAAVDRCLAAVDLRVATLSRYLPAKAPAAEEARALAGELERMRRSTAAEARADAARSVAARAGRLALVGSSFDAASLARRRSFPLLERLSTADLVAMALWPWLALWPVWSRRARSPRLRLALPLAFAAAVAAAWPAFLFPAVAGLPPTGTKAGIASGDVLADSARFAPIPFGYDETSLSERLRPPTWLAASAVDADGRYAGGEPRVRGELAPAPDPFEVRPGEPARNAATRHVLGTDSLGRDVLARTLHGARTSLGVGAAAALLMVAIGVLVGAWAGFAGGRTDFALSRAIEVVQCFPTLALVLALAALIPPRTLPPAASIALIVGGVGWTGIARLARAEFLRLEGLEFVAAARAMGLSGPRVAFLHVLPNALGPILVAGTFAVATGILSESAVSFLGFGVEKPVPSWGSLLDESRGLAHWWLSLFPGLAIFAALVSCHLVGEALRDALDPKATP